MKFTTILAAVFGISASMVFAAPKGSAPEPKKTPAKEEKTSVEKKPSQGRTDEQILADAKKLTDTLTPTQKSKLLELLNNGDAKALQEINGVGEKRAQGIIAKRPHAAVDSVALVDDIGEKTFANIVAYGKGEQLVPEKKPAPKTEDAKKEPAKKKM